MAVQLQAGGNVPGGSYAGAASGSPSDDTPANYLNVPDWQEGGLKGIQIDAASERVGNFGAVMAIGASYGACVQSLVASQ